MKHKITILKSTILALILQLSFSLVSRARTPAAHIKIEGNFVTAGFPFAHTPSPTRESTLQILGPNTEFNSGGRLTFGDVSTVSGGGFNVVVGEYGTTDTDQLLLQGKLGTFFTYGANTDIAMKIENGNVHVTNQLWAGGLQIISDKRLKTNIQPLSNVSGVFKLKPVTYQYKESASLSAKVNNEKGNNTVKEAKMPKDKIGFLAQDVQEVYPQLVSEDGHGNLSVDYVSMIPLLVETLKVQQAKIDALEIELKKLKEATK